jgi:hypothetical protein
MYLLPGYLALPNARETPNDSKCNLFVPIYIKDITSESGYHRGEKSWMEYMYILGVLE